MTQLVYFRWQIQFFNDENEVINDRHLSGSGQSTWLYTRHEQGWPPVESQRGKAM